MSRDPGATAAAMPSKPAGNAARTGKTRRRVPSQDRSVELVRTVLDATAQVLSEVGLEGASTNKIATRAGVAVGSIYQYFPNKEALIDALVEDRMQRLGELARARMDAADPSDFPDAADSMIRSVMEFLGTEPGLAPILMSHALVASGEGVARQLREEAQRMGTAFLEQLDGPDSPDLDVAVFVTSNVAGLFGALLANPDLDDDFRDRVIDEVVRMMSLWMSGIAR